MKKMERENNQKDNMGSFSGENPLSQNPEEKTIIHNEKTYYIHPIYTNYAASKDGYVINLKRLIPRKGRLRSNGYLDTCVCNKRPLSHRIIWESINQQLIPDGYQIHRINSDKKDNLIDNLELVTRQQNMQYEGFRRKGKIHFQRPNVPVKCDVFHYHHIYSNYGANKYGQIFNKKN